MASAGGAGGTLLQRVVLIDFVVQPQLAWLVWKQNPPAWATNLVEHKVETVERTPHPNPTANRNPKPISGYAKQLPNIRGQIWFLVLISVWQTGRRPSWLAGWHLPGQVFECAVPVCVL